MPNNRITRLLSRLPQPAAEECPGQSGHFAPLPLAELPSAVQQAIVRQAELYRLAYQEALRRLE